MFVLINKVWAYKFSVDQTFLDAWGKIALDWDPDKVRNKLIHILGCIYIIAVLIPSVCRWCSQAGRIR